MTDSSPIHQTLRPPSVKLTWTATAFGAAFGAYRVYRRPARTPVQPWTKIGDIQASTFLTTPAIVEAQHNAFIDYEAGWYRLAGSQWAGGWDYAVTVQTSTNGLESLTGSVLTATIVPESDNGWVTCNRQPWLNTPVRMYQEEIPTKADFGKIENTYQGRDYTTVRTPKELPSRTLASTSWYFDPWSTDQIRGLRALEASGESVALLRPLGDRIIGDLTVPTWKDVRVARTNADFTILETSNDSVAADFNLPAGVVLNGSSQYVTTPDNALLNPGTGPFSIVVGATFSATASKYALSKGNLGTSDGYGLRTTATANELQFFVDGATSSGGPSEVSSVWFDGNRHVAVATHDGSLQKLYRDGVRVAVGAVTTGTITNAVPLVAGANNAGASGFSALAPLHSWAYYPRVLTDDEAQAASYWLLGYHGYRMPPGAAVFYDFRDTRGYGVTTGVNDLAGNGLTASLVAAPPFRGWPWELSLLEKFS